MRCCTLDVQSHELRQAVRRSGERACPVEFERDVRTGWGNVEACPQPLVVHETGCQTPNTIGGASFREGGLGDWAILVFVRMWLPRRTWLGYRSSLVAKG
jgi:hypothetical protein